MFAGKHNPKIRQKFLQVISIFIGWPEDPTYRNFKLKFKA